MMRSWENRPDTTVCDEPLYAHYLKHTGLPHPGAEEIIAHQENDWRKVAEYLTGPIPGSRSIFYQKHMAHHLLPNIERDWLNQLTHCFLIRSPREMLPSLDKVTPNPTLLDTGLPQQCEIFNRVRDLTGIVPPVLDSIDILNRPREMLTLLCNRLGIPFLDQMLSWPPGPRATDGIWAKHWYASVENSTEFKPYQPKSEPLSPALEILLEKCVPLFNQLHCHRIQPHKS